MGGSTGWEAFTADRTVETDAGGWFNELLAAGSSDGTMATNSWQIVRQEIYATPTAPSPRLTFYFLRSPWRIEIVAYRAAPCTIAPDEAVSAFTPTQ